MTFNVGYHNAVDGWYEEVWFPQPFDTLESAEECAFKVLTGKESVHYFIIHERGVGIRKAYLRVPGVGWEAMDVQGVNRMSEEVIERVERIAEELEAFGASLESDTPPSFDDDDDEDPDNLKDWLDDNLGVHYTINEDCAIALR